MIIFKILFLILFATTNCKIGFNINIISGLFAKQEILKKTEKRKKEATGDEKNFLIEDDEKIVDLAVSESDKYFSYNNLYNRNIYGLQFDFAVKNYFSVWLNMYKMNDPKERLYVCSKEKEKKYDMFCYLHKKNILYVMPYMSFLIKNLVYLNFATGFSCNESEIHGKFEKKDLVYNKIQKLKGIFCLNFIFSIGIKILSSIVVCINIGFSKSFAEGFKIDTNEEEIILNPYHLIFGFNIIIEQNYSSKNTLSLGSLKSL